MNKRWLQYFVEPSMMYLKGNQTSLFMKELLQFEQLTWSKRKEIQQQKLASFLHQMYHSTRFYRERVTQQDCQDISAYSLLTKDDITQHDTAFINHDEQDALPNSTGGTSGKVLRFFMSKRSPMYYEAARRVGLQRLGIEVGEPKAVFWGNLGDEHNAWKEKFRSKWLRNERHIPAYDLDPQQIKEYVKQLNRFQPHYFYGYPSIIYSFLKMASQISPHLQVSLKGIISTAEKLDGEHRQYMEEMLGCSVYNEYGARDAGIIGYECLSGQLHLFSSMIYTEVCDPFNNQILPEGQLGELVVTDMTNTAMPKVRYRLGDMVCKQIISCPCGVEGEVLTKLQGRVGDILIGRQGERVHGQYFSKLLRSFDGVEEYQVIQKSRDEVYVFLISNQNKVTPLQHEEMRRAIGRKLGVTKIHIEEVDHIDKGVSGKYRPIKREFEVTRP